MGRLHGACVGCMGARVLFILARVGDTMEMEIVPTLDGGSLPSLVCGNRNQDPLLTSFSHKVSTNLLGDAKLDDSYS